MRLFLLFAALLFAAAPGALTAKPTPEPTAPEPPASAQTDPAARRAELLAALRASQSPAEADPIVAALWRHWREGPELLARALLLDVDAHLRAGDRAAALRILDQITRDYPGWAEGWNMRATVLFLMGRDAESLSDIERVLVLEPAHFGALAGRGRIHLRHGRERAAREAIQAAMAIHPWIPERHLLPDLSPAPAK